VEGNGMHPFLETLLQAWNDHDLDSYVAHWSVNCQLLGLPDRLSKGRPIDGHGPLRQYYTELWDEYPDSRMHGVTSIEDDHGLVMLWHWTGSTNGRQWSAAGASYFRLDEDGLILWDRATWDGSIID
jgi:hypothetical protein